MLTVLSVVLSVSYTAFLPLLVKSHQMVYYEENTIRFGLYKDKEHLAEKMVKRVQRDELFPPNESL